MFQMHMVHTVFYNRWSDAYVLCMQASLPKVVRQYMALERISSSRFKRGNLMSLILKYVTCKIKPHSKINSRRLYISLFQVPKNVEKRIKWKQSLPIKFIDSSHVYEQHVHTVGFNESATINYNDQLLLNLRIFMFLLFVLVYNYMKIKVIQLKYVN